MKSILKKYAKELPSELSTRYGGTAPYTKGQIEKTVRDLKLDLTHINYALIMFGGADVLSKEMALDQDQMLEINNLLSKFGFSQANISDSAESGILGVDSGGDGD